MARSLNGMVKLKTCPDCGHTFDPNSLPRDLSDPDWLPTASAYCSHECSDRFHRDLAHHCATHVKQKAHREAAKAAHPHT
jgi:hypothetical protein